MPCEEYDEQLTDYVLGDADEWQAAEIESHLASCEACAGEVHALREIIRTLREADGVLTKVRDDPHFRSRVIHKIPQRRRELVTLRRRRTASRASFVAAIVAAALFVVVIIYLLAADIHQMNAPDDRSPDVVDRQPARETPEPPRPADRTVDSQRQEVVQSQETLPEPAAEMEPPDVDVELVVEHMPPAPVEAPEKAPGETGDTVPDRLAREQESRHATEAVEKPATRWVARLNHARAELHVKRAGTDKWVRGSGREKIFPGDSIRTARGGGGNLSLAVGGAAVLNRSTTLTFNSYAECELEKGEILACSYKWPLTIRSGPVRVLAKRSDVCVRRKTRRTWVMAINGSVQVISGKHTAYLTTGTAALVAADGKPEIIKNVDVGGEIEWVGEVSKKFKVWLEGECCSKKGYFVLQQTRSDFSNSASAFKMNKSASLSWRMRLPHAMPCHIWVRYARRERESENIGLEVNGKKVGQKTITEASARWFWIRAFKVALKRRNVIRLYFESKKPIKSRVDLILITNDPGFKPPRDMPRGGFYGKK